MLGKKCAVMVMFAGIQHLPVCGVAWQLNMPATCQCISGSGLCAKVNQSIKFESIMNTKYCACVWRVKGPNQYIVKLCRKRGSLHVYDSQCMIWPRASACYLITNKNKTTHTYENKHNTTHTHTHTHHEQKAKQTNNNKSKYPL